MTALDRVNAALPRPLPEFQGLCIKILSDSLIITDAQLIDIAMKFDPHTRGFAKCRISVAHGEGLATSRNNSLTLLVIAAHRYGIRISVCPSYNALSIEFMDCIGQHKTILNLAELVKKEAECSLQTS